MTLEFKKIVIKLVEGNADFYKTAILIKEQLRRFKSRDALDILHWVIYSLENEIEVKVKGHSKLIDEDEDDDDEGQ